MKNITTFDVWNDRGRLVRVGWSLTRKAAIEHLEALGPTDVFVTVTTPNARERFYRGQVGGAWERGTAEAIETTTAVEP